MKTFIMGITVVVVVVYAFMSMVILADGIYDSTYKGSLECTKNQQYRIVKLFPTYKLGCWLGEREEIL